MDKLIRFQELPVWVPGEVLHSSDGLGWQDVATRGYRYRALDVPIPALAEFMIVSYTKGCTQMQRRFEGRWTRTECHPGDLSLLTRSQFSHWQWTQDVEVSHAYLSDALLSRVAADVIDRPIADVRLHDLLCVQDPVMTSIIAAVARETQATAPGSTLYAEALGTQLAVHLLRRYASIDFHDRSGHGQLAPSVCRRLRDFIEAHLDRALSLRELAELAGVGEYSFGKRFRTSFGISPHQYVMTQRLARAQRLLAEGRLPVKAIAAACGFADQAHLTRLMRDRVGLTPGALRQREGPSPPGR